MAKAVAVAPDIVDHALPSARTVRGVQKFRNRRKTRCNRSDWPSFSKQSWNQLLSGMKGSAYRPSNFWSYIFQVHNVWHQLLVPVVSAAECAETRSITTLKRAALESDQIHALDHNRNNSALRSLLRSACVTRKEYTLWDADYCFGLSAFRCQLFF